MPRVEIRPRPGAPPLGGSAVVAQLTAGAQNEHAQRRWQRDPCGTQGADHAVQILGFPVDRVSRRDRRLTTSNVGLTIMQL